MTRVGITELSKYDVQKLWIESKGGVKIWESELHEVYEIRYKGNFIIAISNKTAIKRCSYISCGPLSMKDEVKKVAWETIKSDLRRMGLL